MTLNQAVGTRILEKCKESGMKVNSLANLCGVTPSTFYSLVGGTRNDVMLSTIKKVCDGLEITLREFFDTNYFSALEQEIK